MSLKLGTQDISGISQNTKYNAHHLLDFKWTDCIMNDVSWLRADTFSWQSGDVYVSAYNHLVIDISGTTAETETIGNYTITFYRATDGHKICLADQESTVLNIYNESGIAWYYVVDTTNTQFKLPRTKFGFEGLRTNVGDKINESLPNITGGIGIRVPYADSAGTTGAFYYHNDTTSCYGYAGSASGANNPYLDASRSSATYQDNAPVQERATQMYLYFYVGDYSQTAIEQTAGINTDLFNGKADVNLANLNNTGNIAIAHNAMPSDKYVDLTLGASETIYTAPADGWFSISKTAGSDWYTIYLRVLNESETAVLLSQTVTGYRTTELKGCLPVRKGQKFKMWYNATGATNYFRFVYAQGSESEAS